METSTSIQLGDSSIAFPRLAYGTVFMGPRGDGLAPEQGADLLIHAYHQGVNFWDTSEDYGTHTHIACALQRIPRTQVIISSKLNLPAKPMDGLLQELNTTYVDILLVHDVSLDDVNAARNTLVSWQEEKANRRVRAIGLSTHSALVAEKVYGWQEVDVLMIPINATGYCLPGQVMEGGMDRMKDIAEKAWKKGKGIIAMKVMGFGTFADQPRQAIEHVAHLPYVHSLCIGMRNIGEIDQNVQILQSLGTTFDIGLSGYSVHLLTSKDLPALQKLYDACLDYMLMVDGHPAGKNAAEEEFRDTPPGKSTDDKFMFGIMDSQKELIGVLDVMRGYPDEATWWIGLLLCLPGVRSLGIGRKVLEGFARYVKAAGGKAIMLGVVAENEPAYRFWRKMGFEFVLDREPTQFGNKVHIVRVMRLNLE